MVIQLSSPLSKFAFLALVVLLFLIAGTFIVRTAIADRLIAVVYQQNDYDDNTKLASADAALRFAPNMPNVQYQRGVVHLAQAVGDGANEQLVEAISSLRTAARLSPEDFRIQIALGQALSRHDEAAAAKQAFQRAQELAPGYYEPYWVLGNLLLRANDTEAAFAAFRQALAIRPSEIPLLFDYAWNAYNGDVAAVTKALAPLDQAKAQFAGLLVTHGKSAEGMKIWQELHAKDANRTREQAQGFIYQLLAGQQFGTAYNVWKEAAQRKNTRDDLTEEQLADDTLWFTVNKPDDGSLLHNGNFEGDLLIGNAPPFLAWRLTQTKGLSISRDNTARKDNNIVLRLNFDVSGNIGFGILEQTVPVTPGAKYHLSFVAKTEDLITLSAPIVEVYDPADTKRLRTATKPLPLRNNDWANYDIDFAAPAGTETVVVRLVRNACGEPPCPINGKIWLDDFKLEQK